MRSFRTILSKIPVNVRIRFLEGMTFANDQVVHVRIGDLRGVLSESDIQALMDNLGCDQDHKCNPFSGECIQSQDVACNPDCCKPLPMPDELGSLLIGTPPRVRRRFLDSLDFENGHLTRADTHLVKGHVDKAKINQLPQVASK